MIYFSEQSWYKNVEEWDTLNDRGDSIFTQIGIHLFQKRRLHRSGIAQEATCS